jgi:predicted Rossmann-fold nucleotide-binding protein
MPEHPYLHFTGQDLAIAGTPRPQGPDVTEVDLVGTQSHSDFLHFATNAPAETLLSVRRLLEAHGISIVPLGIAVEGKQLVVTARLERLTNDVFYNLMPLLREGMMVAKPHHFNGRDPVDADRLRYSLIQEQMEMTDNNLDLLPADGNTFRANADTGQLAYYHEAAGDQTLRLLQSRLMLSPGKIDEHSTPLWIDDVRMTGPGRHVVQRVKGIRSRFHTIVTLSSIPRKNTVIESPQAPWFSLDQNNTDVAREMSTVAFQAYDRRRKPLIKQTAQGQTALEHLQNYQNADKLLSRLKTLTGAERNARPAALVLNTRGIAQILRHTDDLWVRTANDAFPEEARRSRQRELPTTLMEKPSAITQLGQRSSEVRLLHQMRELGMDESGVIVSETYPGHAALDAIVADEVHNRTPGCSALMFRHPSIRFGDYFSKHDYTAMENLLDMEKRILWAHPGIRHWNANSGDYTQGTMLELTRLEKRAGNESFRTLTFVPPDLIDDFRKGFHMAFYGTARTLKPEYLAFLEQLFAQMGECSEQRPIVVHSGGGPNTSTMGVANRLAREQREKGARFLSIGHVLGVKKEPMNQHLDGLMPFRNHVRDIRQGNMAAAVDCVIAVEGGGGTREERGISQTDLAIARDNPYPLLLIGEEFYEHEYLQYLHEVGEGTLDAHVLNCISLISLQHPEHAAEIIQKYILSGEVQSVIPEHLQQGRAQAIEKHDALMQFRRSAWHS